VSEPPLGIGLIGCGTVGCGVLKLLRAQRDTIAQRLGRSLELRRVLVRRPEAPRGIDLDPDRFTDDPDAFFADEQIRIVVEVAGGVEPVGDYVYRAIDSGRHVVTANKALLAAKGSKLFALARANDVCLAFEASCGGGIPILSALKFGLAANRIDAVYGILNGTCNYILTEMDERGADYDAALSGAQHRGFAEADPTLDVNGADAAQKLAIIASLAFRVGVRDIDVTHTGIDGLHREDLAFGRELGYTLKLLAIGERLDGGLLLGVEPCFLASDEPLAQVRHSFNAISVFAEAVGHVMFYGHGAGQMPTASSVVSDIINVAGGWYPKAFRSMRIWPDQHTPTRPLDAADVHSRYYLRITAKDMPGVFGGVATILGNRRISIESIIQHAPDDRDRVPIVITTARATAGDIRNAAAEIANLEFVRGAPVVIRIVDFPQG